MVMKTLPLSEAKAHFSEIADEAARTHERVVVTRNGRAHVVVLAVEDLDALEATLEILSDPETQRRLAQSDAELARGEVVSQEELAAAMANRRRASA